MSDARWRKLPENFASIAAIKAANGDTPDERDYTLWVTSSETVFQDDDGVLWVVPAGFVTDFASIPKFLWWWRSPSGGPYVWASILHDFVSSSTSLSREDGDHLFLIGMQAANTDQVTTKAMWLAVRCCGWPAYHRNQKRFAVDPNWRILGMTETDANLRRSEPTQPGHNKKEPHNG